MSSRFVWFVVGIVAAMVVFSVGAYAFIRGGGVPMGTTAAPLPFERDVARIALSASYKGSLALKSPQPLDERNLIAGAHVYQQNCVVCHGAPGTEPTSIAQGMFPNPPQLFTKDDMVTDDPEGETYWKVTNGIRLSGMPGFERTLSDIERWQVTMVVAHADTLPPAAQAALRPESPRASVSSGQP